MKLPTLLLFLLSYSVSALSAPAEEIQLQIDLDRTAFFVGEPVFTRLGFAMHRLLSSFWSGSMSRIFKWILFASKSFG